VNIPVAIPLKKVKASAREWLLRLCLKRLNEDLKGDYIPPKKGVTVSSGFMRLQTDKNGLAEGF
jgi:hypothetical protein